MLIFFLTKDTRILLFETLMEHNTSKTYIFGIIPRFVYKYTPTNFFQ